MITVYSDKQGMIRGRNIQSIARTLYGKRAIITDQYGPNNETVYVIGTEHADGTIDQHEIDWIMKA